MKFDYFVIPFSAGLVFLLTYLLTRYALWFLRLSKTDKRNVISGLVSVRLFQAGLEIIKESLLHKRIFSKNRLLGYMHMSLAFGWFMLILAGNLEDVISERGEFNLPYVPIFFRYFNPGPGSFPLSRTFSFVMDLLLLFVLTGVLLAFIKRFFSRAYGMKRTTKLKTGDRFALFSLWMIFPLRLLAEALASSVYGGGSFLTGATGKVLGSILPVVYLYDLAWWAYSLSLGVFFTALPFSRYMHIPTEVVLILSRHFGLHESGKRTSFTEIEINACSRCGICLDACQLSFAGGIHHVQSAYQLKAIRYHHIKTADALNCLMCGRCQQACPVGIDITGIRQIVRHELNGIQPDPSLLAQQVPVPAKADVIYFAGCMTHQTPGIKNAMVQLMSGAGVNFWFMDERGGICCGRPVMLAGHHRQAEIMMENNVRAIRDSGAHTLVTSCPICYKIFMKDYGLKIKVQHHTQYLADLVAGEQISLIPLGMDAVYHDPCELSRDLQVHEEPRQLLSNVVKLQNHAYEKEQTLCCGGSLANLSASNGQRLMVAADAFRKISESRPQMLLTSCPMCKKAFERVSGIPVRDVAEVVCEARVNPSEKLLMPLHVIPERRYEPVG